MVVEIEGLSNYLELSTKFENVSELQTGLEYSRGF